MEVLLPEAGMIETKIKQDLEYTWRALHQVFTCAQRAQKSTVLHRPDMRGGLNDWRQIVSRDKYFLKDF
jgi:hypothetical protein